MSDHPLRPIFEPRSVGVIGASTNPEKRGHQVVAALQRSGYGGPIVPVNPRGGELLGLPVSETVGAATPVPELVYVATPAATVPSVVRECGEAGVRAAVVPAVGFKESGEAGARLEVELATAARETGVRVIGPNTSGLLNTHAGLHMVGGEPLAPGGLAIVSQSGNVALDLMTAASRSPLGVSIYVGPGNESDVRFDEIIDFLAGHEPTRAIAMYVEGVRDGRALVEAARRASASKPLVVLKGGRSEAGSSAARSHTGAIAGSHRVFEAAARRAGMVEVDRSDELLPVAEALALQPGARRRSGKSGFVVISDGGGHGTIAADRFAALGVPLARLEPATREELVRLFGPASSATNPVDAAGAPDAAPSVLASAVAIAAGDPACAGVLLIGLFGGYAIRFSTSLEEEELRTAGALPAVAAAAGIPLVVHSLYAGRAPRALRELREAGVPVHGSLETAAACCAGLWRRAGPASAAGPGGAERSSPTVLAAASSASRWLSEVEMRDLVEAHGVHVAPGRLCRTAEDVSAALASGSGPWAVKAVSARLPHKTEAGAVRLGVPSSDVQRAFDECVQAAAERVGPEAVDGALVSEMLPQPIAELLVGVRRDPGFGPVLTVGFGGTAAEVDPDAAVRLLPLEDGDVKGMLTELRRRALLEGFRGRPPVDRHAIETVVRGVVAAFHAAALEEAELNPVFCYADRAIAVDAVGRRPGG